jgi:glutathione S-transferase
VLTLYQAEWCPYSSSVRERLTELGLDFVACQVAPEPDERDELRALAGTDSIPVLATEDGEHIQGVDEIFAYLARYETPPQARGHRRRYHAHREEREQDEPGRILEGKAPLD